jgi:hypothetical protein
LHYRYRRPRDDGLPTARTTLRTGYVRVLVFCNSCRHQADADLQALVDAGRGDVPLTELRFSRAADEANPRPQVALLALLGGFTGGMPGPMLSNHRSGSG